MAEEIPASGAAPKKRVRVTDPDHIKEVFCTGGAEVLPYGANLLITGFVQRPNPEAIVNGDASLDYGFVVGARMVLEPAQARVLAEHILAVLDKRLESMAHAPNVSGTA